MNPEDLRRVRDGRDLAVVIAELQDRVRALETAPRLGGSSIERGTLDVIDDAGTTTLAIGEQFDGTYIAASLSGPPPPQPSAPIVTPVEGGLIVRWDGAWADPAAITPMDFARVEVHTSTVEGFDPLAEDTLRASFTSPRGEQVFLPLTAESTHWAALVARSQSGKFSDPSIQVSGTVPAAPTLGTDGIAPASSPTPEVIGGIGVLHVRWAAIENPSPVTYEVHLSTVNGFTPDASTLAAETDGTVATLKALPDGTALSYGPEDAPTVYYVRLVAKDADAPAAASPQGSDTLYKASNAEISAAYAYLGNILADQIDTGILRAAVTLAGQFKTADTGQRAVMDPQGIHLYGSSGSTPLVDLPTDPTKAARFNGEAAMTALSVSQKLTVASGASGAQVVLADRVSAPALGPGVVLDHEVAATGFTNLPIPTGTTPGSSGATFDVIATCVAGTDTYLLCSGTLTGGTQTAYRVVRAPVNGGDPTGSWDLGSATDFYGICWDGAALWMLARDKTADQFYARKYNTTLAQIDQVTLPGYRGLTTRTRTNMVTNPSFETNTTGWSGSGGTIARVATPAPLFGGYALRYTRGATAGQADIFLTNGVPGAVTAGQTYAHSVYVYSPAAARNAHLAINWFDVNGQIGTTSGATVVTTVGAWTRITVIGTAPANATQAWPDLYIDNVAANEVHYVDGVLFEKNTAIEGYFDGSVAANVAGIPPGTVAWTGTAHASTSTWTSYTYFGQGIAHIPGIDMVVCGLTRRTSPNALEIVDFPDNVAGPTLTVSTGPTNDGMMGASRGFMAGAFDFGDGINRVLYNDNGIVKSIEYGNYAAERTTERFEVGSDGGIGSTDPVCWDPNEQVFRQVREATAAGSGASTFGPVPWKRFTGIKSPTTDPAFYASYTLRDSVGTVHETDQGARTAFAMKPRYRIRLSSAAIPNYGGADDPNAVSFYLGRSTTTPPADAVDPGRTGMFRQGGILANGVTTLDLTAVVFSGANPPDPANNPAAFPAASPATLVSQKKRADGAPKTYLDGGGVANVDGLIPPGTIIPWAGPTGLSGERVPAGWVLCDGRELSRALYPDLAAVLLSNDGLNYVYGNGNGTTTFNVPNLRGKFPSGTTYPVNEDVGATGGEETHVLTIAEMPSHNHTGTGSVTASGNASGTTENNGQSLTQGTAGSRFTHPTGMTTTFTGGGAAHNNLPPYVRMNFLIKT